MVVIAVATFTHHVLLRRLVAAAKSFAIFIAQRTFHTRMTIGLVIVCVLVATTFEITSRSFNSFVEPFSLGFAKLLWRFIPGTFLAYAGRCGCSICFGGHPSCWRGQRDGKSRNG